MRWLRDRHTVPSSVNRKIHYIRRQYINKPELLAWCAGVFEGEGCVICRANIKGGPKRYTMATVSQKDRRLLDKFKNILGFGQIYKSRTGSKVHVWQVTSASDVLRLYEYIAPYIGPVKEKQFQAAFALALKAAKQHGRVL